MRNDGKFSQRRSIRVPSYDYSLPGKYFIAICVKARRSVLSRVSNSELHLLLPGRIVDAAWHDLPNRFLWVSLDAFVVMPNHVHGIITTGTIGEAIVDEPLEMPSWIGVGATGVMNHAPTRRRDAEPGMRPVALGEIVRTFKAVATRSIRKSSDPSFAWQRNFYEHIIRSDRSLERIRDYIAANPARWAEDRYYVEDSVLV